MSSCPAFSLVLTTVSTKEKAAEIAKKLVENKLAACVNVLPSVSSVYFWDGKICQDEELLLVIKTQNKHFERLKQAIIETHDYELPEIIEIPIANGYDKYLKWIEDSTV